ncbi:PAS domain S-box-containing protein [Catalinimonas alkaloidigena]|uniref:histidine kinase dimerization/phosphoacceptor domain -containing protein n=1 Tax=Catalinimonas alkaloidigena TaxID=1075417 RepID=UPI0024056CFD|nr:histidine kinase dimerization/phosphoacceptor domain -containing protein [Catalinimonas alkaloidigena]MDF9798227.1 PAS domain S-box-containing protein [Catalinimonas alkaloidigena]
MNDSASSDSVDSRISRFEKELFKLDTSQLLTMMKQHLSDGYCITDDEGIIVDVNDSFCSTLEYRKEELLTKNFAELLPQGIRPYALMLHHEYISGQTEENAAEWAYESKSGKKVLLRSSTSRLALSPGHTYKLEILQLTTQAVADEQESMKKIMHQFKNTLQEIGGLLQLQAVQLEGEAKQAVVQAQRRTSAIALAFELLHKSTYSEAINIGEYLSRLTGQFGQNCQLHLHHQDIYWQINKAYAFGIIITESLNSLIAAGNTVMLHLTASQDKNIYVCDLRLEYAFSGKFTDFSRQLINALGRQLQAKVKILPDSHQILDVQCPL